MSRSESINIRKSLIEKAIGILLNTPLFKVNALYPKRYFDDLMIEDSLMQYSLLGSTSQRHQSS